MLEVLEVKGQGNRFADRIVCCSPGLSPLAIGLRIAKKKLYRIIDSILHETIFQSIQLNDQHKPKMRRVN